MADMSLYMVDLDTPRPNPNNPLEVRKGDAPSTAFSKTNAGMQFLGDRIDGATIFSNTAPNPAVAYMSWIDTSVNPALLKRRRADNKAWVTIGPAFQAFGKDTDGTPLLRRDMGNLIKQDNPGTTLARLSAEPRYVSEIDLTGLSTDRYYPVWWGAGSPKMGIQKITIARNSTDDANLDPFGTGNSNVATLFLDIEQANIQNALSSPNFSHVKNLTQNIRKTVRNIRHAMRCSNVLPADGQLSDNTWTQNKACVYRSGLYLRGGLTYRAISNFHPSLEYSTIDTEVEIFASSTFSTKGRWMVKSYDINDPFLGPEYDNFTTPYNAFPYPV